jgi:hypothetical protein
MTVHTQMLRRKLSPPRREQFNGNPAAKLGKATCGARTRKGTPCRCLALANGRCKLHGGLSTGPKTAEGWARVRAAHAAYWAARRAEPAATPCSHTLAGDQPNVRA